MRVFGQNIQRYTQTLILTLNRRKEEYTHARTRLMPANAAYAPMVYTGPELNDVQIEGKAVGWTHWVG